MMMWTLGARSMALLVACGAVTTALASDPYLPYQGRLLDSTGAPLSGDLFTRISLYRDDAGNDDAWRKSYGNITFADGYFNVALDGVDDAGRPLQDALDEDALWIGVAVSGGQDMMPLQRVGSGLGGNASTFPLDTSGGTTCSSPGEVRWTGSQFQGCDGNDWLTIVGPGPAPAADREVYFSTGTRQTFEVPSDVSSLTVKLWGAGGGGGGVGGWSFGYPGGAGGYSTADIAVTPGELLTVVVGQAGAHRFPYGRHENMGGGGGGAYPLCDNQYAASGGGRTAIFRGETELITAGGGGGGGSRSGSNANSSGGVGGGASGGAGLQPQGSAAGGGTQSAGGAGASASSNGGSPGTRGIGGSPLACSYGGGGGGGYYGGGGGGYQSSTMGGGGGGSGYIGGTGITSATTTAGSGQAPPNISDADYVSGIGVGGNVGSGGGDGLAVIRMNTGTSRPVLTQQGFIYTGSDQTWTVPDGVNEVLIKVWGAGGGGGDRGGWTRGFPGGAGGFTTANVPVTPGQEMTVIVGQAGDYQFPLGSAKTYGGGGGANQTCDNQYGASGGGRSAVLVDGVELLVAGGGGGGGSYTGNNNYWNTGGAGGGLEGEHGYMTQGTPAQGGTQTGGGSGASGSSGSGAAGARFNGGNVLNCSYGGGGGGGYYGGGGGGYTGSSMGGGAGGSGYVNIPAVTWYATQRGWMNIPPTDEDLPAGAAHGGQEGLPGGHGYVVFLYE